VSEESDWRRVRDVLEEVIALDPAARRAALDVRCGDDAGLRAEVESLLIAGEEAAGVFAEATPADTVDFDAELVAPRSIGAYRVVRELGRGGMGSVYLGERSEGDFAHRVAIKVVRAGAGSELVLRRFRAERQILAALQHAGIARLYDGGLTEEGMPYLVMEYVEGGNLLAFCAERRLGLRERVALFARVCEAVRYAHRHLVVHRDLKPSNILVSPEGEPKLLDFGLAKIVQPPTQGASGPQTVTSLRWMTPEYASPEQVRGEAVTTATDVYSLGVVLYELLTGRKPYALKTATGAELEHAILGQDPARASSVAAASSGDRRLLRGDLDTICAKCLQKDPQRRYGGAAELAEDLGRYLRGMAVRARPDSAPYRMRKFVARHRWGVGAAAALAVTAMALTAVYTVRLRHERDRARLEAQRAEQVATFLTEIFRTGGAPSAVKPSAADLLGRGVERIESLDGQPELQASLLLTLGTAARLSGDLDRAETLLRRSVALREESFGTDSLEAAASLEDLGKAQRMAARFAEAAATLERALAIRRQRLPPRDPAIAASLDALAGVHWALGHYREATDMVERAVAVMEAGRPDDAEVDRMRGNLGQALEAIGELERARGVYQRMLEHAERLGGPEGPNVVFAVLGLGTCALADEDFTAARKYLERAVSLKLKEYGSSHSSTAEAQRVLGSALVGDGEWAAGRALLDTAVATDEDLLGPRHPELASALVASGRAYLGAGQLDRAAADFSRALEIREQALGASATQVGEVLVEKATLELTRQEPALAEPLLRRALEIERRGLVAGHRDFVRCLLALGQALRERGRLEEARPRFEEAVEIARRSLPARHSLRRAAESELSRLAAAPR
jgi:serine/threonine-protein kinase